MKCSLYDRLVGTFAPEEVYGSVSSDDAPHAVFRVDEDEHLERSVVSNLSRLFNTRRGSVPHLPEYGLPDVAEVYRDMPDSVEVIRQAIKEAVEAYEPRLRRVLVRPVAEADAYAHRLEFILSGELIDRRRVQFRTVFASGSATRVSPMARRA